MKIDLKGKSALVTGSTSGIGHAIAKGLAGAGAASSAPAALRVQFHLGVRARGEGRPRPQSSPRTPKGGRHGGRYGQDDRH